MRYANGDKIEIADVLASLIREANPKLTRQEINKLIDKYYDAVWEATSGT